MDMPGEQAVLAAAAPARLLNAAHARGAHEAAMASRTSAQYLLWHAQALGSPGALLGGPTLTKPPRYVRVFTSAAQAATLALHLCRCGRTGEAGKHDMSLCAGLTRPRAQARNVPPSPFSREVARLLRLHGVASEEQALAVEGLFSVHLALPGAERPSWALHAGTCCLSCIAPFGRRLGISLNAFAGWSR